MLTSAPASHEEIDQLRARVNTLEQERRHLLALIEVLREIGGSLHYVDIVQGVARRLGQAFGLDRCSVFLAERGGGTVHLVASYEDPSIRNHVVDLGRYPELRRALDTGRTVNIPDISEDPELAAIVSALSSRMVKAITVVPITWKGTPIGAIFLRTFREGPACTAADIRFVEVVAELTATALRNAHRFERLQARRGAVGVAGERERAALLSFMQRVLDGYAARNGAGQDGLLARSNEAELDRLADVALTVIGQETQES